MHAAGFDTIVEGEETDLPMDYRGNAAAFKDSPMAKLLEEYTGETSGNELSTETSVTLLVTVENLDSDDIEKVDDPNRGTTKYRLTETLFENLRRTSVELQVFVERAAGMLEERNAHFIVDPRDTLLHILRGTTSLPQLNVAWKTIQRRLELGHRTLQKYQQQYKQSPQEELLLSPISTVPELHNELQNLPSADQRLRYLYQKFPHHHEQISEESETALSQGKTWLNIIPLPPSLKNVFGSERDPKRKEESHNVKGKRKESSSREDVDNNDTEPNPPDRIWLGAETPFKGPNKWFGGDRLRTRGPVTGQTIVGATKSNQNVLFGLATPQLPIWAADSVDLPSSSKRPRATRTLEETDKWANHDAPPHLPANSDTIRVRNSNAREKGVRGDPPDDDGDNDDDPPPPDRGRRRPTPSHKGSSNSGSSSKRGRRRGGGPPSEPSDGDESDGDSGSESNSSGGRRNKKAKAVIPYGRIKPTIKTELKQEQLPRWDGNPNTAVKYFLRIQQLAALEGDLPEALGYWLWMNLEDGSDIKDWFTTLTFAEQAHMRSHYINYLRGIKDGYLGEAWQSKINRVYETQYFRQIGHEKEQPKTFIIRRIMYTRMLTSAEPGSILEINLIMRRAPLSWKTILVMPSIKSTKALYTKVVDYEDMLLEAWRRKSTASENITMDNLIPTLKRLGWEQPNYQTSRPNQNRLPQDRRVMLTVAEDDENDPNRDDSSAQVNQESEVHDDMLREVYQVMQRRQRAPPPGGYMFSRNDHVTTKMGRLPPSPCQACGSDNHWDKECPDWEVYRTRLSSKSKDAHSVEKNTEEGDKLYQSAYGILLSQRVAAAQIDLNRIQSDFDSAVRKEEANAFIAGRIGSERKTGEHREITVEEIDDESTIAARAKKKSTVHVLIHESECHEDERPQLSKHPTSTLVPDRQASCVEIEDESWAEHRARPKSEIHVLTNEKEAEIADRTESLDNGTKIISDPNGLAEAEGYAAIQDLPIPPPPKELKPIRMTKKRFYPAGESSVGVSVLAVKGWVGNLTNERVDLRLDSCADVTLISSEYYDTLKGAPSIQQGIRMRLWQLTDKDSTLRGFVRIPIFMMSDEGDILETEAEAYVVPGMTVPILLGEDFQLTYELGVSRNVEEGPRVHFGRSDWALTAQQVERTKDFERMRQSAYSVGQFIRSKLHRRRKNRRHRQKVKFGQDERVVRAKEDYRLRPHECKPIRVEGQLGEDKDWLVSKNLLSGSDDTYFAVPNTLISSTNPWVPVTNPSDRPRYIRKGEIIGVLSDPSEHFDHVHTLSDWEERSKHAEAIAAIIQIQLEADRGEREGQPDTKPTPPDAESPTLQEESFGPKTAEMPDLTEYPSSKMKDFIDVGSLPDHLRDKAWQMLEKRVNAFGFDGRLGHLPTKVHIRTADGQVPISVPMYGSSPEKRRFMDVQLDTWFEQGVIEPSISPWSAPVVIAYRNGKPRFCIDYRKLNAVTTPDEFPIPRQSEILSSLSGAQVLSSLDALSGFTQLELDPEDIEKTAFRTHRGLFQFKRMPFGLRNGPSIFQRVMQGILAPYLWLFCLVYIDDIVVYSKSYEEHIDHLDLVLEAIEKAGITLSPNKCHLFYGSILLLGHKVSRLGLSTHLEKVRAILELERPKKLSQLQTFLGMVVYFSAFIPYYASICTPLFQLLRKGARWHWGADEEYAFEAAKNALRSSPVLGHPIEGLPYRLYTDASDEALGCALQQIQPITVKDLQGTRAYTRLRKQFDAGLPPPKLTTTLSAKILDSPSDDKWGESFDSTIVHVERVVAYWSRTFKSAESRYSTTEREALAAKEGLVKFQPYIEGEKILLITDHSALQWARTYENSNRRLAAWGAVFSAYAPNLEIIHRAGRVHSNVDPLSRLPRAPPDHTSPLQDEEPSIATDFTLAEKQERQAEQMPARTAFTIWSLDECLEGRRSAWPASTTPVDSDELDEVQPSEEYWKAVNPTPNLHIAIDDTTLQDWIDAYKTDEAFKTIWEHKQQEPIDTSVNNRYLKDERGLLYFVDPDYQPRLCVPKSQRNFILREAHENPLESSHAGPERLWQQLSQKFYWKRMKSDVLTYVRSCDTCQKTKFSNFNKYGYLIPNPIPCRPYQSVSMDFIVNLPWSGGCNAIFVVVDRLSKHASFIPTSTGLTAEEFGELYVRHIGCRFGLPESIVTDRDPRWTSDFWKGVAKCLKTKMSLSSSHHPQHDGQTEIVNKQLVTMLRAYVNDDLDDWASWLHVIEFAYNNSTHSSTGTTPFFLLYGFHPRTPLDFLRPSSGDGMNYSLSPEAINFLETLAMHRDSARRSIATAQDKQATQHNKNRRAVPEFKKGSLVLVNPHSLEWVDSKGAGAKLKQRWIGPFEVIQRINPNVYRLRMSDQYPGYPVFNIEHIKLYNPSDEKWGDRTSMKESSRLKAASEEYAVEAIVGHRRRKRGMEWLVRWEGYGPQFDTWEPTSFLKNAPIVLNEYRRANGL